MAFQSEAVHSFPNDQTLEASRQHGSIQTQYDPGQTQLQPEYTRQNRIGKSNASYNYKPVALRSWFLIVSAAFFLACLAVIEYAIRSQPTATNVYKNDTLTARDDIDALPRADLGPISQDQQFSPKGMPRIHLHEPPVIEPRVPSPSAWASHGTLLVTNYFSGSIRSSIRSTTVYSSEIITTDSVVTVTTTEEVSNSTPVSTLRNPVGSLVVLTRETSTTDKPVSTHGQTSATTSESIVVIPAVVSTVTEKRWDPSGTPTTILHTTTLQPARTSTSFPEAPSGDEVSYTDSTKSIHSFMPIVTTFTATVALSNLISSTITIPEVLSTYIETTDDLNGSKTTILHTSTIQTAHTTTEVFDGTVSVTQTIVTTVITSTIEDTESGPQTTLVEEVITIPGVTTKIREFTTDSFGNSITRLDDSVIPAHIITTEVISTLNDYNTPRPTMVGLETQQQRLVASSAALPTVRVLLSTFQYTTLVPTSIPTWAPLPPDGFNSTEVEILGLTTAEYFFGEFLPTILAVIASLFIEGISNNVKRMQPFFTLASSKTGATAEASLLLSFDKWFGAMMIPQAIRLKQPLIVITQIAVIGSQVIAPLSAEAVQIYTPDSCTASCFGKIAVQVPVARVVEALLGITAALMVLIVIFTHLESFRTGVNHNPWSVAGMASLCGHPHVRKLFSKLPRGTERAVEEIFMTKALTGHRYALGNFSPSLGYDCFGSRYGLILDHGSENRNLLHQNHDPLLEETDQALLSDQLAQAGGSIGTKVPSWLRPLTWWFRLGFIAITAAVLGIVVYYQETSGDSRFERFMDSRSFGVRFLFTGLGVLIGGLMGAIFECVALITPYHRLSQRSLPADRSILLSTPNNSLSGMSSAYFQRSPLLGIVSLTTALAKIVLPVTLDQVPFSYNSTWISHQICAWLSIFILALTIVVVAGLFVVEWPPLPVDPSTIAGAMFYIFDSQIVDTFDGLACRTKKDRDNTIRSMGSTYAYWQTVDDTGMRLGRPRIDTYDWKSE